MLTEEEIRRIARRKNLNVGLTEKDYVIEWLVNYSGLKPEAYHMGLAKSMSVI